MHGRGQPLARALDDSQPTDFVALSAATVEHLRVDNYNEGTVEPVSAPPSPVQRPVLYRHDTGVTVGRRAPAAG
jgi:hypothetical protein